MTQRKKWATSFPTETGESPKHARSSERSAYLWVKRQADLIKVIYSPMVMVWVDEQDGQGWRFFERIDLRDIKVETQS